MHCKIIYYFLTILTIKCFCFSQTTMHKIDFSQFHNYNLHSLNSDYPSGEQILGGIPFYIPETGNNIWHSENVGGSNPKSISINIGITSVNKAHLLVNNNYGVSSSEFVEVEFHGTGGFKHVVVLKGDDDIRDWNEWTHTNNINGTTTINVWNDPNGYWGTEDRMDKQEVILPAIFHSIELEKVVFCDYGQNGVQRAWLAGLTIEEVDPESFSIEPLTLNNKTIGYLDQSYPIQRWGFSGVIDQLLHLEQLSVTQPWVVFDLIGPYDEILFEGLSEDFPIVTVIESGSYELIARLMGTAENITYSFYLNEISVNSLSCPGSHIGYFEGNDQSQLFKIDRSEIDHGNPLRITLKEDTTTNNFNELYIRQGLAPDRGNYDHIFPTPGPNQEITVPNASANDDWYIMIYTAHIETPVGYTLTADEPIVVLDSVSPAYHGNSEPATLTLTGAGFDEYTTVELVDSGGRASYPASSIDVYSDTELMATFDSYSVPVGLYSVFVTDGGSSTAELTDAFEMVEGTEAAFETNLIVPGQLGYHQVATIWIEYSNTGNVAIPAPLLVLRAYQKGEEKAIMKFGDSVPPEGFWTSAMPEGFSTSVQFLAMGDTPGLLQPGESISVPVQYAGWLKPWNMAYPPISFELSYLDAHNTEPVGWNSMKEALKPDNLDQETWDALWLNFIAQTGSTWGDYISMLSEDAVFLAKQGQHVTDIGELLSFEFSQADGVNLISHLSIARDGYVVAPGIDISFRRVFPVSLSGRFRLGTIGRGWSHNWDYSLKVESDGTVNVFCPGHTKRVFKPDMRPGYDEYFPMRGDHAILTEYLDGFRLLEQNGLARIFDSEGILEYVEDPNGHRITCEYTANKLTGLEHSTDSSLRLDIQYDGDDMLWKITDPHVRVTTLTYDTENEHLISAMYFDGKTVNYDYHTTGSAVKRHALIEVNYPGESGQVHQYFTYNDQGRLENVYKGTLGSEVEKRTFTYDDAGTVFVSDNITRNTFEFCLDHRGLTTKSIDPLGNTSRTVYDDDHNLTKIIDPVGSQFQYAYDGDGNLTQAIDAMGCVTSFEYDYSEAPFTRMTKIIDARGIETKFEYDPLGKGNLEYIKYDFEHTQTDYESWTYDPVNGNMLTWTNRRGQVIAYNQYDTSGKLLEKNYPDGTQVTYGYNSRGLLEYGIVTTSKGTITTSFDYDIKDRLQRITYSGAAADKWLEYTYHGNSGLRASCVNHLGHRLEYHYDGYGRLSYIDDGASTEIVHYYYFDPDDGIDVDVGRIEKKVLSNGVYTIYDYDEAWRLTSLVNYMPDDSVLSSFEYNYDQLGRRVSMTTQDGTWTYGYDDIGQLTSWIYLTQDMEYEYDAVGNRLYVTENGGSPIAYDVNNLNQYEQFESTTYTYDGDGNMEYMYETLGTTTYEYDCENRLIEITSPSGHWLFTYDAFGNRIKVDDNSVLSEFVIDPVGFGDVVGEYDSITGNPVAYYDHGIGLLAYLNDPDGMPEYYFYSFDAIGNTSELTDDSVSPVLANEYLYDPFGISLSKTEVVDNPFEYVGEFGVMNESSGMEFMRERYYDSNLGRFVSPDPIGFNGGDINLYRYVSNSPSYMVDPMGLWWVGELRGPGIHYHIFFDKPVKVNGEEVTNCGFYPALEIWGPNGIYDFYKGVVDTGQDSSKYYNWRDKRGDNDKLMAQAIENVGTTLYAPIGYDCGTWVRDVLEEYYRLLELQGTLTKTASAVDPNEIIGPSGYGKWRVVDPDSLLPYRVNFENDYTATAPAQIVTISNPLDDRFDWSTFSLTGVGFGDIQLTVPPNKQHFETIVPYSYLGVDFDVHVELGIHLATGEVYANFYSIDPATGLPPAVQYGFLPPEPEDPEESTGAGMGYFTYTIKLDEDIVPERLKNRKVKKNAKIQPMLLRERIPNIAEITFDFGETIATNQVDPHDPSAGTDPEKEAYVSVLLNGAGYVEGSGVSEK